MSFDSNTYLSWYLPRVRTHESSINLHSSGVPPLNPSDFEVVFEDPWTAISRFEETLAHWLKIPPAELILTPGATGGTLLALLALTSPGSHIVVESPLYEPMVKQAKRLCHTERLTRHPESKWRLPLSDAEKLMKNETQLVMITEPNNPSGCFAPSQDVLELAEMCKENKATLLINEVYRRYSDRPSYHGMAENIIVVSSLSKLIGAYWARLGWLSASEELTQRLRMAHMNFGMGSSPNAEMGQALMKKADTLRANAVERSRVGQSCVQRFIDDTPGVSWIPPQGPGFGCLSLPKGVDDMEFAENLHKKRGVLVVPGSFFEAPGTLRISWLQTGDRLDEGLEILAEELLNYQF